MVYYGEVHAGCWVPEAITTGAVSSKGGRINEFDPETERVLASELGSCAGDAGNSEFDLGARWSPL